MQQLQQLLTQLSTNNTDNAIDVNALSSHVFAQIAAGKNVSVSPLLRKRTSGSGLSPLSEEDESVNKSGSTPMEKLNEEKKRERERESYCKTHSTIVWLIYKKHYASTQ